MPEPHPTCASVLEPLLLFVGCCTERRCGLTQGVGFPCRSLESLRADAGTGAGPTIVLPEPRACD